MSRGGVRRRGAAVAAPLAAPRRIRRVALPAGRPRALLLAGGRFLSRAG